MSGGQLLKYPALFLLLISCFFITSLTGHHSKIGAIEVETYGYAASISKLRGLTQNIYTPNAEIQKFVKARGITRNTSDIEGDVGDIYDFLTSPSKVNKVFKDAYNKVITSNQTTIKEDNDLGYALFVYLSFLLFGLSVSSLAKFAFLLFAISCVCLLYFSSSNENKIPLRNISFIFVVSFFQTVMMQGSLSTIENFTFYCQRSLDFLALVPLTHLALYSITSRLKISVFDIFLIALQCLILAFSLNIRSTVQIYLLLFGSFFLIVLFFQSYLHVPPRHVALFKKNLLPFRSWVHPKRNFFKMLVVAATIGLTSLGFKGYQASGIAGESATGNHGIWHNLVVGLSFQEEPYDILNIDKSIKGDAFTTATINSHSRIYGYSPEEKAYPYWQKNKEGEWAKLHWQEGREVILKEIFVLFVKNNPNLFVVITIKKFQDTLEAVKQWFAKLSPLSFTLVILSFLVVFFYYLTRVKHINKGDWTTFNLVFTALFSSAFLPMVIFYPANFLLFNLVMVSLCGLTFNLVVAMQYTMKIYLKRH